MEPQVSPLDIQELLDSCIRPLRHSASDMGACSLVSRRWLHTAQHHIFREISVRLDGSSPPTRGSRLLELLRDSPHLIGHIARLELLCEPEGRDGETFLALCNVPFTHLEHVSVRQYSGLSVVSARAVQQLLGAPALQRVQLTCSISHLALFAHIWERCAQGLRHLELFLSSPFPLTDGDAVDPAQLGTVPALPITLESLRLGCPRQCATWLTDPLCPLDLSALKVFSRPRHTVHPWSRLVPAPRAIEVLDFAAMEDEILNLAWFPHLTLIRIEVINQPSLETAVRTLSSLPAANYLRRIVVSLPYLEDASYIRLAATVSSLPLQHPATFELEMNAAHYEAVAPHFHGWISAQNTTCRTDPDSENSWFQKHYMMVHNRRVLQ
ncbi:hypothetical protein FB451DRAFT_1307380 [Mycena latifolia]|nr:hypothetical protein FB451DRAFT_1307380 [Mycena latifolia]